MKLTIAPGYLRAALTVALSSVPSRTPVLPVLGCVLLDATPDGGLIVSGTDLDSRSSRTVPAEVSAAGAVALPPAPLRSFLDAVVDSEPITLTVDGKHKAELISGRTRVRVAGFDPESFPVAPSFGDPSCDLTLSAEALRILVSSVAHAVAPDDSRPVLAGILLQVTDGTLTAVTADGYRLAMRSVEVEPGADLDVIVQGKALIRAARLAGDATSARLMVDAGRSMLQVDTESGVWSMRLVDGQFPGFRRVIPKDAPVAVTVDRDDLTRAMRLIKSAMNETTDDKGRTYKTVMARLTIGADSVEVSAKGTDGDQEAEITLPATLERGEGLTITINGAYLTDAIGAIDTSRVTFEMAGPASPVILRPAGDGRDALQVLMPMHDARKTS